MYTVNLSSMLGLNPEQVRREDSYSEISSQFDLLRLASFAQGPGK